MLPDGYREDVQALIGEILSSTTEKDKANYE